MGQREENHYRNLSEIYQLNYNTQIKVSEAIMTIQGVVVEMYSDLLLYQKKNGKNNVFNRADNRLKILLDKVITLSSIQTDNHNLQLINRRLLTQISLLETELKEQHRQDALIHNFENNFELPLSPENI